MFESSNATTSESIFHIITDDVTHSINLDPIYVYSAFQLNKDINQTFHLLLTSNYIAVYEQLQQKIQYHYYTLLNFDLKFEVIYQNQNGSHSNQNSIFSKPVGFKLHKKNAQTIQLKIVQENLLPLWLNFLSKTINQFGFHKMFKPVKKIGKGGFATVYQVQRITDNKFYAVKAFSKQNTLNSTNENHKLNLLNQIKMLRSFDHPNVIKLEGVFESDNSLYIVLQLLSGGQMHSKINRREGKFTEKQIQEFMIGLTRGLKEMHDKGIMHRDIKPQNIMLRENNTIDPVIVDFGLSAEAESQDYLFYRCGTPGYVAPQVTTLVKGQKISPACDIFSLGVIFHILLTAKPLFQGRKFDLVYENNKKFKFDLQREEYSSIDSQAMDLLKKMLILDPTQRITADQMLQHPFLISFMENQSKQMSQLTMNTSRAVCCYKAY